MSRKHAGRGRPPRLRTLIVCEGEKTEPYYLNEFKRLDDVRRWRDVKIVAGRGGLRQQVVERAVKEQSRREYDEVFCVLDTEAQDSPEAVDDLRRSIERAELEDIRLVLSNPSFEVWLIAHFERTSRRFSGGADAVRCVDDWFRRRFARSYDKADRTLFSTLKTRLPEALANAHAVREHDHGTFDGVEKCNSCTTVDELLTHLRLPLRRPPP